MQSNVQKYADFHFSIYRNRSSTITNLIFPPIYTRVQQRDYTHVDTQQQRAERAAKIWGTL